MKLTPDALTLTYARASLDRGQFGAIPPYLCRCGAVWSTPEVVELHPPSSTEPAEYVWICPDCGSTDIDENQQDHGMKVLSRHRIPRTNHGEAASLRSGFCWSWAT